MIHYNGNKGKGSTIFSRRPRGYIHSIIILFLLLCVAYLVYVNNSLQNTIESLNFDISSYEGQKSSILHQLNAAENENAKAENQYRSETAALQNKLSELNKEKEKSLSAMREDVKKCASSFDECKKHSDEMESRFTEVQDQLENALAQKNALDQANEKERLEAIARSKEIMQLRELRDNLQEKVKDEGDLRSQIALCNRKINMMQKDLRNYAYMKILFNKAGVNVINVEHEAFKSLSTPEQRGMLGIFTKISTSGADLSSDSQQSEPQANMSSNENHTPSSDLTTVSDEANLTSERENVEAAEEEGGVENLDEKNENSDVKLQVEKGNRNLEDKPLSDVRDTNDPREPENIQPMDKNVEDPLAATGGSKAVAAKPLGDEAINQLMELQKKRENIEKEKSKEINQLVAMRVTAAPFADKLAPPKDESEPEPDQDDRGEEEDDQEIFEIDESKVPDDEDEDAVHKTSNSDSEVIDSNERINPKRPEVLEDLHGNS